jgi:hypothetical protein
VTGSQVRPEGKLTLTVTVPDTVTVTPDTQVTLRFEPLQPGLPEHNAAGKLTDILTLGAACFIVTALEPDFASTTIAIVAGSLEESMKQQLEAGAQMPPFAQVDLVTRESVTREEVLDRAQDNAGVVFVFGDLAMDGGRYGNRMMPPTYGRVETATLPLPAGEILEQLGAGTDRDRSWSWLFACFA